MIPHPDPARLLHTISELERLGDLQNANALLHALADPIVLEAEARLRAAGLSDAELAAR